jgi:ABC-2 type transport system permease protein
MMVQGTELIMGRTFEARAASNDLDLGAIQELFEGENGFLQGFADPTTADEGLIHIDAATLGKSFSWLDYTAASMAVLFLMFAVTSGGRTLLYERERGTLSRLLIMPAPAASILAGKMAGIALAGVLQVLILWGATSLLGAYWGDPLLVLISIVVLVACATSVGALISAWARTPAQAGAVGTAVTLVGAALSGSFLPRMSLPLWLQRVSLATPNAWGIEIFTTLQRGGGLAAALPLYGGALLLAAVYFGGALLGFRRQFD